MSRIYNLVDDFVGQTGDDFSATVTPCWVIAIFPYFQPLTFSRTSLFNDQSDVSFTSNLDNIDRIKDTIIIVDCPSLSISGTKSSFAGQLQASLIADGKTNYLSKVMPGDLVMAWIVNSESKRQEIIDNINGNTKSNDFNSGLKFLGRVDSMRKKIAQSASGTRQSMYALSAVGFREFDYSVYLDPQLHIEVPSFNIFLARLTEGLSIINDSDKRQAGLGNTEITTDATLPFLLKLFFGQGIPSSFVDPSNSLPKSSGGLSSQASGIDETPYSLAIPKIVGKLLGRATPSKKSQKLSYIDVLEVMIGRQQYGDKRGNDEGALFAPDNIVKQTETIRHCGGNNGTLFGTFLPMPTPFTGKNVWSILNEFLNPALNEMYCALRINVDGNILPTLTVRQIPFSSPTAAKKKTNKVTPFLSLPRWIAAPLLIRGLEYGRSDALHFNMVQIYGQAPATGAALERTVQMMQPGQAPKIDTYDIVRHGIKLYSQTVACSPTDTIGGPKEWMSIAGDWLFGQQFTLTGSCMLQGIVAPICYGDNFEVDGVVFHIEAVSHSCSMDPNGNKDFVTTLSLTNGLRTDADDNEGRNGFHFDDDDNEYSESSTLSSTDGDITKQTGGGTVSDASIYSGMDSDDNKEFDPGITTDILDTKGSSNG